MSETYDDHINRIEREHYGSDDNSLPPDESAIIHTPYSEVVKLSASAQEMEHVLRLIVARCRAEQGEWADVQEPYAPDWCDPYRKIIEIAERAL